MAMEEMNIVKMVTGGDGRKRPFSERGLINAARIVSVVPGDYDPFMEKRVNHIILSSGETIASTNTLDEIKAKMALADKDVIETVVQAINEAADAFNRPDNQLFDNDEAYQEVNDAYNSRQRPPNKACNGQARRP